MKRIVGSRIDFNKGFVFTDEEFKLIKSKAKKYWKMINRDNYNDRNFVYVYEEGPNYFCQLFHIFKFENFYVIDNVNGFHSLWKCNTIEEVLNALEKY